LLFIGLGREWIAAEIQGTTKEITMPKSWSSKDERQYEHVKASEKKEGKSTGRAKEIAARTVNKHRKSEGRTKS
jgi:hypothetical protein